MDGKQSFMDSLIRMLRNQQRESEREQRWGMICWLGSLLGSAVLWSATAATQSGVGFAISTAYSLTVTGYFVAAARSNETVNALIDTRRVIDERWGQAR